MIHSTKVVLGTVLPLLFYPPFPFPDEVELTAGPWPLQISKAQRRSTVAGVIRMRVVGCQMQDKAQASAQVRWINPGKLQLIWGGGATQAPCHSHTSIPLTFLLLLHTPFTLGNPSE